MKEKLKEKKKFQASFFSLGCQPFYKGEGMIFPSINNNVTHFMF
jgi:hypothetical protein